MRVRFFNIRWETYGDDTVELPTDVTLDVPDDLDVEEQGADCLSDKYDWLVLGCHYEILKNETVLCQEHLDKIIALLESGDDAGCDGLVVVGRQEFMAVRQLVKELTGADYGYIDEDELGDSNG